jgi:uncharacterized membrane protein
MTELMVFKSNVGAGGPQQIFRAIAYNCCKTQEILKILIFFCKLTSPIFVEGTEQDDGFFGGGQFRVTSHSYAPYAYHNVFRVFLVLK